MWGFPSQRYGITEGKTPERRMAETGIWRRHGGLDCSAGKTMGWPWLTRGKTGGTLPEKMIAINDRPGYERVRPEVYRCRETGEQNGARVPRFVARALPGGMYQCPESVSSYRCREAGASRR